MYGAILGDIIGSPYEFDRGAKIKAFPLFIEKSRFTDDTVMTIAVADALLYAGKDATEDKICAAVTSSMQHWGRKQANDAESGIDINYDKTFYLNRDMAKSILAKNEAEICHTKGMYIPMPDDIPLSPKDLSQKFISGVRFCLMCAYDAYTNYCELYHRNGKIYRYDISGDNKQVEKICRVL